MYRDKRSEVISRIQIFPGRKNYLRLITSSAAPIIASIPAPMPAGDACVVSVGIGVNVFFAVGFFVGVVGVVWGISGISGIATRALDTTFLLVSFSSISTI